jgi:hypothetical protein
MDGCTCQDCVYSAHLDWAKFEKSVVLCTHPHMGCVGNWAQRIVQGDMKPCENFMSQYRELSSKPKRESSPTSD